MGGSGPIFDIEIELVASGLDPVFRFGGSGYPWKDDPWIELFYDGMVRSGPEVDFLVVSDKEIEHLEEGERFKLVSDLTTLETTRSNKRGRVPPGEHWLAVWNHTNDEAKISIEAKGFTD